MAGTEPSIHLRETEVCVPPDGKPSYSDGGRGPIDGVGDGDGDGRPATGDRRRWWTMTRSSLAPEPLVLRSGASSAVIHPTVGGRLGQLDLGDGPLLRDREVDPRWDQWGCFPLLPWSNRIPGGRLRFGDINAQLPVNADDGSAIHGLVASVPWTVVTVSGDAAELVVVARVDPYWVLGRQIFQLLDSRLHLTLSVTNAGERTVPAGLGIHPWFHHGAVRVPADRRWPGEPLPTGPPQPVGGAYDLRSTVVPGEMDACFTALTDSAADVPGARLRWDGPVTNVVVYTGKPGWTCVEPVTMPNGGFSLMPDVAVAHGVQLLAPGASTEVRYQFERPTVPLG